MTAPSDLLTRIDQVKKRIQHACRRAGRDPQQVGLVCVSKTVAHEAIREAYGAGGRIFGENYGQHLRDKARELADLPQLSWHFIGPLQRNKVKYVVGTAQLIHSVHSEAVLQAIDEMAAKRGGVQQMLLQVNVAGEASKSGVAPQALAQLLDAARDLHNCQVVGLMTMPPWTDDPELARPHFQRLKQLLLQHVDHPAAGPAFRQLSMGTTGDFEVAVEEGATLVRVGTAIFGPRQYT